MTYLVNVKDLNRIFNAELGRRPTDEEVEQILGEGGRRATVQGSEDIVYDFITEATSLPEESKIMNFPSALFSNKYLCEEGRESSLNEVI